MEHQSYRGATISITGDFFQDTTIYWLSIDSIPQSKTSNINDSSCENIVVSNIRSSGDFDLFRDHQIDFWIVSVTKETTYTIGAPILWGRFEAIMIYEETLDTLSLTDGHYKLTYL